MRDAIRELDPERPITLGVDAETFFRATGVDARDAIATCEFAVSHVTVGLPRVRRRRSRHQRARRRTSTPSCCASPTAASRCSPTTSARCSLDNSPAEEAAALRTALWSGLANRASGALVRRFRDLETERREPYYLDPFETLVGVVDADGELKPSFAEARRFLRLLAGASTCGASSRPPSARPSSFLPSATSRCPNLAGLFDPRACLVGVHRREAGARAGHASPRRPTTSSATRCSSCRARFASPSETWDRLADVRAGRRLARALLRRRRRAPGDPRALRRRVPRRRRAAPRLSCRVAQDGVLGALDELRRALSTCPTTRCCSAGTRDGRRDRRERQPAADGQPVRPGPRGLHRRSARARDRAGRPVGDAGAGPRAAARGLRRGGPRRRLRRAGGLLAPEVEVALFQGDAEDLLVLINHAPVAVTRRPRRPTGASRRSPTLQGGPPTRRGRYALRGPARRQRCGRAAARVQLGARAPASRERKRR